ncbi:MAG: hypothetical protein RLZ10_1183 [Bacteroidota bacterium]|jgi:peptidoglycan/xylan/chitin deacetylase (PgdA/CDA1 family)
MNISIVVSRILWVFTFPFLSMISSCGEQKEIKDDESVNDSTYVFPSDTVTWVSQASKLPRDSGLVVYFTFDDGLHHTTPGVVKVLKKNGIKASFFIIGSQRDKNPDYDQIYLDMVNDTLFKFYNHTYSHAIRGGIGYYYKNPHSVLADLEMNRSFIPKGSNHIRLPGKNTWRTSHRFRADDLTQPLIDLMDSSVIHDRIIGWDVSWVESRDFNKDLVDSLILKIVKTSKRTRPYQNHVVVLSHDYHYRTEESLESLDYFIRRLKKKHNAVFEWAEDFPN